MAKIFISYRRDDSADITGRIYDYLTKPLGPFDNGMIFKDVDSMPFGVNFKTYIQDALSQSRIVLVVIGQKWVDIQDAQGQRRLDNPQDFVRIEVETALERKLPIIPLLVMNASMPLPEQLPPGLVELAYRNGLEIRRDPDFKTDMSRLILSLEQWIGTQKQAIPQTQQKPVLITYYPYSDKGKSMARHLNTLLKASNYKTWIDYENREDWEQGNWRDNMLKVIQRCSFLVAVYTEEQGKATEFFYEIGMAKRSDVPVIFLKLPGIDIPDHIAKSGIGIVDTGNSLSKEWFETLEDLIQKA